MTLAHQLKQEGLQQGLHQGLQQSRQEERYEMAKNLLAEGLPRASKKSY